MNAVTSFSTVADPATWKAAITAVNAWRGQAIHHFARAEAAVSETLLALSHDPARGGRVKLRRLVGQRFDDLAEAIGPEGAFADADGKAAGQLAAFRAHLGLRDVLCHGAAKVSLDQQGNWVVMLRLIALGERAERNCAAFDRVEAELLLANLRRDEMKLAAALDRVRASLD